LSHEVFETHETHVSQPSREAHERYANHYEIETQGFYVS